MQESDDELELKLYGVQANKMAGNLLDVTIHTSNGDIHGLLHPVEGETGAVLWIGGANGNMNGPANGLYADLSHELVRYGVTSFRLVYRQPGEYEECVLDALAGLSFLRGIGARKIAVVGHSFGGAVAIASSALSKDVVGVVALSSQNYGTRLVPNLAPNPLLLVHGMDDFTVPTASAEDIYQRAQEPKRLVLYPGTGHGLMESRADLEELLREWLTERVGNKPEGGTQGRSKKGTVVRPVLIETADHLSVREVDLFEGDIAEVEADALVCTTNEQLWLGDGVAKAILERGGEDIMEEALYESQQRAPVDIGSAHVFGGGRLKAKYVIAAVTMANVWFRRQPDDESVREATRNSLKRAEELQIKSIAFPALGTGYGGFAFEKSAHVLVQEVVDHLRGNTCLEKVIFALFNQGAYRAFEAELKQYE